MSTRRKQDQDGPFRPERFASSTAFSRGLLGNLVARRAACVNDPELRELIYFLQDLSWREPELQHGTCNQFPAWPWPSALAKSESAFERAAREMLEGVKSALLTTHLAAAMERLCLDPASTIGNLALKGFPLVNALGHYKRRFEAAALARVAETQTAREIWSLLEYSLSQRGLVLGEGAYRVGKSIAAQGWAQSHLGVARYVQLASSTDEFSFYSVIARALGIACGSTMKGSQIRFRIEATLREQHLLLIIDEADWLLPQAVRLREVPQRLSWVLTALCNAGVPVALLGSRNFSRMLTNVERQCKIWGAEQFHGRLMLRKQLPEKLATCDLFAIARKLLPDSEQAIVQLLVGHAMKCPVPVPALQSGAGRARFFATEAGNTDITIADMLAVLREAGTLPENLSRPVRNGTAAAPLPGRRVLAPLV